MPTWSEILTELKVESAQGNSAPFDFIRRKYLSELSKYTNRNIILYATAFTQKGGAPELLSVTEEDVRSPAVCLTRRHFVAGKMAEILRNEAEGI